VLASGAAQRSELAGDQSFTLTELAAEVSRQTGKQIRPNMPQQAYLDLLLNVGLPKALATGGRFGCPGRMARWTTAGCWGADRPPDAGTGRRAALA
jgi:hypothetical protein